MIKPLFLILFFFLALNSKAQLPPIFDYTWTIEQIDTGSQVITADLNPFGAYDTIKFNSSGVILDNMTFYELEEVFFGHCQMLYSFDDSNSELFYHLGGCLLSNDDSSQIAIYFNEVFIAQNTNMITIDNDFVPLGNGPLNYSFSTVGDIIYLDITNTIGETARFWTNTLNKQDFLDDNVSIYPNPVSDIVFFQVNDNIQNVKIYNLLGRLVLDKDNVTNNQLDLNDLDRGTYVMKIETSYGVFEEKLVKN